MWIAPKLEVSDKRDASGKVSIGITHGRFTVNAQVTEVEAVRMVRHLAELFGMDLTRDKESFFCNSEGCSETIGGCGCVQFIPDSNKCLSKERCFHRQRF